MDANLERLRSIKSFPSLVKYLREELDWPIESDDVEDLTFEYEAEELGLDARTVAKIKDIKQLRPFVTGQPWGIFYINFEHKQLPIVAPRRIMSKLVLKKRTSGSKAQQATWQRNDLLFISSYGESEERAISFAHFSEDKVFGDLPTLRVLGWDSQIPCCGLRTLSKRSVTNSAGLRMRAMSRTGANRGHPHSRFVHARSFEPQESWLPSLRI